MSLPPKPSLQLALLSPACCAKVRAVEAAMRTRFRAAEWPEADIDLLFAHYLFGLVMAALPDADAPACVAALTHLGGQVLDADAIECALHRPMPGPDTSFARIAKTVEAIGGRDALALVEAPRSESVSAVPAGGGASHAFGTVIPLAANTAIPAATRDQRGEAASAAASGA